MSKTYSFKLSPKATKVQDLFIQLFATDIKNREWDESDMKKRARLVKRINTLVGE